MVTLLNEPASGIVLPGKDPLELKEIFPGAYIVVNAYQQDEGYFERPLLYRKDHLKVGEVG